MRVYDDSNRYVGEYDTRYIYSEKDNNLALPNERINKIKNDFDFAKKDFLGVIGDIPGDELEVISIFLNSLKNIEAKK